MRGMQSKFKKSIEMEADRPESSQIRGTSRAYFRGHQYNPLCWLLLQWYRRGSHGIAEQGVAGSGSAVGSGQSRLAHLFLALTSWL
jgi:hypothetical protein